MELPKEISQIREKIIKNEPLDRVEALILTFFCISLANYIVKEVIEIRSNKIGKKNL